MKKILLACAVGFSTSMLAEKMQQAANKRGLEVTIEAQSEAEIIKSGLDFDVLLLGPQLGHAEGTFKSHYPDKPIATIDMMDYGMMNGEKVLDFAMKLLGGTK